MRESRKSKGRRGQNRGLHVDQGPWLQVTGTWRSLPFLWLEQK